MVRNYKRKTEDRWTKEDLLEALTEIKDRQCSVRDAAAKFKISRGTLYRQLKKFLESGGQWDVQQFKTCGGNPILTRMEEVVLETTVMELKECGNIVTSSDIKRICFEYCASNAIPNQFNQERRMASDDWYYGFIKRHPLLKMGILDKSGGESPVELEGELETSERPKKLKKKKSSGSKKSGGSSSSCSAIGDSGGSRSHVEITAELPVAVAGTSDSGSSGAASSTAGGSVGTQEESQLKAPNLEMVDSDKCTQNLQCRKVLGKRKGRGRPTKDAKKNKKSITTEDDEAGKEVYGVNGIIDEGGEDDEDADEVVEKKLFWKTLE